jgi:hypothetical protein
MSAYFCSKCDVNWPMDDAHKACPDCGQYTFRVADQLNIEPETTVEHDAVGTQTSGGLEAHAWRVARYLELGFTETDSHLLALAQTETTVPDKSGRPRTYAAPVNWQDVAKALASGRCSHATALAIFA